MWVEPALATVLTVPATRSQAMRLTGIWEELTKGTGQTLFRKLESWLEAPA